jgi:hypothetical protein
MLNSGRCRVGWVPIAITTALFLGFMVLRAPLYKAYAGVGTNCHEITFSGHDLDVPVSVRPLQRPQREAVEVQCPTALQTWALNLRQAERKVYSQTLQDGVLEEIFKRIGTTNKYFVEFGFDADTFSASVGANTEYLYRDKGWKGLLLDGGHENPEINLQKAMISPHNIVSLFQEHNVPLEPDYVSIDLDSCDIWVFLELTKVYSPRVITIEYNQNFPPGSSFAWPPTCDQRWIDGDRVMGSSLGAIYSAAEDAGYTVVHVLEVTDAILVRNDIAACLKVLPRWVHEQRCTGKPLHSLISGVEKANTLVDYERLRQNGGNVDDARVTAMDLLQYVPLLQRN